MPTDLKSMPPGLAALFRIFGEDGPPVSRVVTRDAQGRPTRAAIVLRGHPEDIESILRYVERVEANPLQAVAIPEGLDHESLVVSRIPEIIDQDEAGRGLSPHIETLLPALDAILAADFERYDPKFDATRKLIMWVRHHAHLTHIDPLRVVYGTGQPKERIVLVLDALVAAGKLAIWHMVKHDGFRLQGLWKDPATIPGVLAGRSNHCILKDDAEIIPVYRTIPEPRTEDPDDEGREEAGEGPIQGLAGPPLDLGQPVRGGVRDDDEPGPVPLPGRPAAGGPGPERRPLGHEGEPHPLPDPDLVGARPEAVRPADSGGRDR